MPAELLNTLPDFDDVAMDDAPVIAADPALIDDALLMLEQPDATIADTIEEYVRVKVEFPETLLPPAVGPAQGQLAADPEIIDLTQDEDEPDDDLIETRSNADRRSQLRQRATDSIEPSDPNDPDDQMLVDEEIDRLIAAEDATRELATDRLQALDMIPDGEVPGDDLNLTFRAIVEDSPALAQMDEDMWKATCAFFLFKPTNDRTKVSIPRLKRSIYPYQLQGAYFMLLKWADFEGALLQDEQGLGKTTTAIVYAATFAWMAFLWDDLCSSKQNHLQNAVGGRCPVAQSNEIPIACPCQSDFPPLVRRKLRATKAIRGFQLFVVPPAVISNWVAELNSTIDFEYRILGRLAEPFFILRVAHQTGGDEMALSAPFSQRLICDSDGLGPEGQSTTLVVTTSQSMKNRLHAPLKSAWDSNSAALRKAGGNGNIPRLLYSCCTCIVDESHQFRQDGLITEFLQNTWVPGKVDDFCNTPLYAGALFLLSGTPWEKGPEDLRIWLTWFNNKWDHNSRRSRAWVPDTHDRTRLCSLGSMKNLQRSLDRCIGRILKGDDRKDQMRELAQEITSFLLLFSIRRVTETKWWDGNRLLDLPKLTVSRPTVEPANPAITARLNAVHAVAMKEVQAAYQERLQRWYQTKNRRNQPMPQIMNSYTKGSHPMRPLVSVPEFEALRKEGILADYTQTNNKHLFQSTSFNALAVRAHHCIKTSSRIQYVLKQVRDVCCNKLVSYRREDGNVVQAPRKLVILSAFPLVALATYFAVARHIVLEQLRAPDGSRLRVSGFFSSMVRKDRDAAIDGFSDALARNKWGEFAVDANRTHILKYPRGAHIIIGTIGTMGVGVNLQRASHAIIMEPQLQNTTTTQAIKRVHRIGQQFPTTVEILTSKQVEAERVVQDKHALNALFAKMVDEAKKNIDMDDDEDEESDEGVV
jgi:hypothetical protein